MEKEGGVFCFIERGFGKIAALRIFSQRAKSLESSAYWAVAVFFILAISSLGLTSLWYDEVLSVQRAHFSWPELWDLLTHKRPNMALYYILLKPWVSVFGDSEFSVRFPSLLFAMAALIVVYAIARELLELRIAALSTWIMAVNIFFIAYAQEARSYSLFLLLTSGSTYFLIQNVKNSSWKNWTAFIFCGALSVYSHLFGALMLMVQGAFLFFLPRDRVDWSKAIISAGVIVILLSPFLFYILNGKTDHTAWRTAPGFYQIWRVIFFFGGKVAFLAPAVFLAALWGARHAIRIWNQDRKDLTASLNIYLVGWAFGPIVLAFIWSQFQPMFLPRYFLMSLPAYLMLAARGIMLLPMAPRKPCIAFVIIFMILGGLPVWKSNQKENWRGVTELVLSKARPGDGLIFFQRNVRKPFEYYREKIAGESNPFGFIYPPNLGEKRTFPEGMRNLNRKLIRKVSKQQDRIWLVLGHWEKKKKAPKIMRLLKERYVLEKEWNFHKKMKVILFQKRMPPG